MENAVEAMKMGFGMLVFVIAISATMYLINTATSTSKLLLYYADETNYMDNIVIDTDEISNVEDIITTRTVGVEAIIPTLYRYYKENFAVQIRDNDSSKTLLQIFDVNIEGKVRKYAGTTITNPEVMAEKTYLMSLYGDSNQPTYLFESPWIGNTSKDIKTRIDLYVKGECGYINGTRVDYTANNLKNMKDDFFEERFIRYTYKGDTISDGEGGTETITGDVKPEDKIVIIYTKK